MPAAGSAIVPGILGIAGLMQGNGARGQAQDAQNKQWELISRQIKAFDSLQGVIQGMEGSGAFDPTARVEQARKDQGDFEQRDLNNAAGAYRIAGYKPGDSPMQGGLDSVRVNYKSNFDRIVGDIRRGAIFDRLGAYQGLNQASGSLNTGIGAAGNQADYYRSQDSGMGGLLGNLMPFLGQMGKKGGTPTQTMRAPGQSQVTKAGAYGSDGASESMWGRTRPRMTYAG